MLEEGREGICVGNCTSNLTGASNASPGDAWPISPAGIWPVVLFDLSAGQLAELDKVGPWTPTSLLLDGKSFLWEHLESQPSVFAKLACM